MKNQGRFFGGITSLLIIVALISYVIKERTKSKESVSNNTYNKEHNSVRNQKNVPLIEDGWIIHESDSDYFFWCNRSRRVTDVRPMHLSKTVSLSKGQLVSEEDDFHFEGERDIAYRLVCEIFFDKNDSVSYRFIKYFKNSYPPTVDFNVDKQFADSIFVEWGLPIYYSKKQTD